jgi:hypothetical protein
LEEVMVPANEEPIRIKVVYVDVSGETADRYEVVVPPCRMAGFAFGRADPIPGRGNRLLDRQISAGWGR